MSIKTSSKDDLAISQIDESTCTLCGLCIDVCPAGVLKKDEGKIVCDNTSNFGCIACAHCAMLCPSQSIVVKGRKTVSTDQILPLPKVEERANTEQINALLLSRRSIRHFEEKEVPRPIIDKIIQMASTAPMGVPPWEVGITVFAGREKVDELANDIAGGYKGLIKFMDFPLVFPLLKLVMKKSQSEFFEHFLFPLGREIIKGRKVGKDYIFYSAPLVLLFHTTPYTSSADAFIACTYAMLSAETMGLGSCMIGCAAPLLARDKKLLAKYGLKEGQKQPAVALILGYPKIKFKEAIKRDFESVRFY